MIAYAFYALLGLLAGYAAREIIHRVEAAGWRKERESLLNRIQARSLGEAMLADAAPPKRGVTVVTREQAAAQRERVSLEAMRPPIPNVGG